MSGASSQPKAEMALKYGLRLVLSAVFLAATSALFFAIFLSPPNLARPIVNAIISIVVSLLDWVSEGTANGIALVFSGAIYGALLSALILTIAFYFYLPRLIPWLRTSNKS